jgi:hypothetical protein
MTEEELQDLEFVDYDWPRPMPLQQVRAERSLAACMETVPTGSERYWEYFRLLMKVITLRPAVPLIMRKRDKV